MRIEELFPDILRRWWVVAIAALVAGVSGYLLVQQDATEYRVSVRLVAAAEPSDYWLDLYAKNRLPAYEPLINNYGFIEQALEDAGLSVDPSHVQQSLSVSQTPGQNVLMLTVVDPDPQQAADVVNAMQFALLKLNDEQNAELAAQVERDPAVFAEIYSQQVVLRSLETAGPPDDPIPNSNSRIALAAALLGAFAGGVLVVLLIYKDDALKGEADVHRYLDRPILAIVPEDQIGSEG